jgi:hypothetical protein
MALLSKTPPPPAPPTSEELEAKKRLDEARKRIGKLSPQLIEDVRLVCNAAIDEIAMRDYCDPVTGKSYGVPFEAVRKMTVKGMDACPCAAYLVACK